MYSPLSLTLIVLCAQAALAGPLRRFQHEARSAQRLDTKAGQDISKVAFSSSAAFLSSLLRNHQTATAFSTTPVPSEPARRPVGASSEPARSAEATPSRSESSTQADQSGPADQPRFTGRPDSSGSPFGGFGRHHDQPDRGHSQAIPSASASAEPNGSQSGRPRFTGRPDRGGFPFHGFGGHGGRPKDNSSQAVSSTSASASDQPGFRGSPNSSNAPSGGFGGRSDQASADMTTTTLIVTTTVLPDRQGNTSLPTTSALDRRPFESGNARPSQIPSGGAGGDASASAQPTNAQPSSRVPVQSSQAVTNSPARPSTTFFVFGGSTLRVTVSTGRGGDDTVPSGRPRGTDVGITSTPSARPTSFRGDSSPSVSGSQPTQSSEPIQRPQPTSSALSTQSNPAAPSTTFLVFGTSTLSLTISSGRNGIPTSRSAASSDSSTTTTITQMRTRFATTTVTPDASSTQSQGGDSSSVTGDESRAADTTSSLPTSFPTFSFNPTSTDNTSPTTRRHRSTVLPSIITPSERPTSSILPTSTSAPAESQQPSTNHQQPPSTSSSPSTSTTTSNGIPGITIIPVNPDATTVFVTITQTDAGATTTIARETVTARGADPCQGWDCWNQKKV